jgi:AraC-like DNA-binding protein
MPVMGHAALVRLGDASVAELRLDGARLARRANGQEAGEPGVVQVAWQLSGRSRVQQGPNTSSLQAGDWTLLDADREYVLDLEKGTRLLLLLLPGTHGPAWQAAVSALPALALRPGGPAHVAAAALSAVLHDAEGLDPRSQAMLHDSVVALVERALTLELDHRGVSAPAEPADLLPQIQAYIVEHLADPGLSVGRVADVFGMSRRSLYNVFFAGGVTPYAFIQGARLDRACALLTHPASLGAPVAGVARQCGFTDPAHFTRAFHARHGVAPTAWREKAS